MASNGKRVVVSGKVMPATKRLAQACAERSGEPSLSRWVRELIVEEVEREFGSGAVEQERNDDDG